MRTAQLVAAITCLTLHISACDSPSEEFVLIEQRSLQGSCLDVVQAHNDSDVKRIHDQLITWFYDAAIFVPYSAAP